MRGGKQPRLTSAARPQHARMLMFKDHSPVALLQVRRRHSLSSMVMWLAVMILVSGTVPRRLVSWQLVSTVIYSSL